MSGDAHESGQHEPLAPALYLVATPIGNLEDITLRALRVLRSSDRIACEDTRQTQKLLNHFSISVPTTSCHEHNERERAVELVQAIRDGARIALVTDAGMPAISDPGSVLVAAAIEMGITVVPVPGPNAAITALVASGLPAASFRFIGFLPEKAGARRTRLEELSRVATLEDPIATLILYEAPHRILDTLADIEAVCGASTQVVVARELTKLHEEFVRGTAAEVRQNLASRDRVRGEITLLLLPTPARADGSTTVSLADRYKALLRDDGLESKDALKRLARETGQSKSDVYRELQRLRVL